MDTKDLNRNLILYILIDFMNSLDDSNVDTVLPMMQDYIRITLDKKSLAIFNSEVKRFSNWISKYF